MNTIEDKEIYDELKKSGLILKNSRRQVLITKY